MTDTELLDFAEDKVMWLEQPAWEDGPIKHYRVTICMLSTKRYSSLREFLEAGIDGGRA